MSEFGCNYCSRSRLGSDGGSASEESSFSGSPSNWSDGGDLDHWLLRAEVDCEWPQLEREIQVRHL